jgi:malonate-semialdehyde dehydrogenase (acetylating)/methylmalonate-semialdehyde dehydrogenase
VKIENLIEDGVKDGAQLLLDGRGVNVKKYEKGTFVGPTVLHAKDHVKAAGNRAYLEEIFGPVIFCVSVPTLEDAIAFTNNSQYGNGCAIFTQSGAIARKYQHEIDVGQVGINVPIPVPLPFFSFTGTHAWQ